MKLIIDIPEEIYKASKIVGSKFDDVIQIPLEVISNCTPIPDNATNICGDDRFEIIAKAKKDIISATNIEDAKDEMECLDSFLFRCWQMGWLDKYATSKRSK